MWNQVTQKGPRGVLVGLLAFCLILTTGCAGYQKKYYPQSYYSSYTDEPQTATHPVSEWFWDQAFKNLIGWACWH